MEAKFWWESDVKANDLAKMLFRTVEEIEKEQSSIHDMNELHAKMYQGYTPPGFGGKRGVFRGQHWNHDVTKNIIRSVCDTATALIGRLRPKATFVTDGGDWELQRKAELLDQAMVGAFNKAQVYKKWQKAFRDSTILGTGCVKLVPRKTAGFVDVERVLIDEIVVDEQEQMTWDEGPSNLFHVRPVDKNTLAKIYPKFKKEIKACGKDQTTRWGNYREIKESQVIVIEAWHLSVGGGEGRHVIAIQNQVIFEEVWKKEWFPFVFLHWSEPVSGFYGQGLAEQLAGRQKRINSLYRFIQRALDLIAVPRVFVDASNQMMKFHLSNEIGVVIPTRGGKPPTFYTPQANTAEIYNWLNILENGGYEEAGISTASASNRLPPGIESAPAQREYSFKEGQRFAPVSQRYEDAYIETARKMVQMYKEMGGGTKVTFANNRFMRQIPWEDVDMENDQYEIRVDASSMDALSPAGRIQAVIELAQTNWITPEEGRRLLAHPDLIASDQHHNAAIEYAEYVCFELKRGTKAEEIPPDGAVENVGLTFERVQATYLRAKMGGASETILNELLEWMKLAQDALAPKQEGPAPMQGQLPMNPQEQMPVDANLMPTGPMPTLGM